MATTHTHPHAEFDLFPALIEDLAAEFGCDGIEQIADRFIAAELADFHWDGRIAERNLGAWEGLDDEELASECVGILGYFRRRYYVATCVVDGERRVHWLFGLRRFDDFESAETAFLVCNG